MPRKMRKRGYKRNRTRRRRRNVRTTKSIVRREISRASETKKENGFIGFQNVDSVGLMFMLTNPPIGTGANERIGNEITPKSWRAHFALSANSSLTTDNVNYIRMVFIKCTRYINPASAATWPQYEEIFPPWTGVAAGYDSQVLLTSAWPKDFKVLSDRTYGFQQNGSEPRQYFIKRKLSAKKLGKIRWDSSSWVKGAILLYVYSDSSVAPHPGIGMRDRLYYKDM
ncbi:MAG: capsid protein [Wigfec virus K19_511]|nr:MAG: capsid protein [Wigfec virus K19_511]